VALARFGLDSLQAAYSLATESKPHHSPVGIVWLAATVAAMPALAAGKARTGRALAYAVLETEARVTLIDGYLAAAVLAGLVLNAGRRLVVGRSAGWPRDCRLRPAGRPGGLAPLLRRVGSSGARSSCW
jgi:hypothetical protein